MIYNISTKITQNILNLNRFDTDSNDCLFFKFAYILVSHGKLYKDLRQNRRFFVSDWQLFLFFLVPFFGCVYFTNCSLFRVCSHVKDFYETEAKLLLTSKPIRQGN